MTAEQMRTYKREYARRWRAKYPEKAREANSKAYWKKPKHHCTRRRNLYWAQREIELQRRKEQRQRDRDKLRARQIVYRLKNPEKVKQSFRNWSLRNFERVRERNRAWRLANPNKARELRQRYRARKRNATIVNCTSRITELKKEEKCFWCGQPMPIPTIDHILALTRGGKHEPDNLVAACRPCNSSKKNRLVSEWKQLKEAFNGI